MLRDATLLVNVTNDAWFGDSTAAHQHLQITRMRALEAGRTLLRAANDGISAIIGPDGRVTSTLPRFQPGVLTGSVQPRVGLTPYARFGNWPVIVLSLAMLLGGLALGAGLALRSRAGPIQFVAGGRAMSSSLPGKALMAVLCRRQLCAHARPAKKERAPFETIARPTYNRPARTSSNAPTASALPRTAAALRSRI